MSYIKRSGDTMKKGLKGIVLAVASLGVFAMVSSTTANAASKTTLPKSYRGTWYIYGGSDTEDKVTAYAVAKLNLTNKKMGYKVYTTTKKQLTSLKWQLSAAFPTIYSKKVNNKKKVTYRVKARIDDSVTLMTLGKTKVNVKVLGKKVTALRLRADGTNVYAFRKPLRTHALSDITY
ncbi:hypothetical protein DIS17_12030 [Levilactobacillus brevis]|uniref:Uncharacterized protein n=3 Tax=Lactobacillaceae TaxID=33958 RepID=A0AAJ5K6N8_LEVBR|nr:hypothetical protein CCS05_11390 [Levilactobacillus brevis]MBL3537517.1 hypothetical protein [Lactobacillus sp. GPR40-2]MBL3630675.1 hypothetical protein [Lactobacillus sp. GPB7-4]MCS8598213.1 hypothetical protein [Levilactobacillus brevis]MCT2886601.1 hypothetical protein [Levilactobacillus brevis]